MQADQGQARYQNDAFRATDACNRNHSPDIVCRSDDTSALLMLANTALEIGPLPERAQDGVASTRRSSEMFTHTQRASNMSCGPSSLLMIF